MIPIALLLGAAIAGVGIVAAFWNDLLNFLREATKKVQQVVAGVVQGCRIFVQKLREAIKEISRYYSKVDQHWEETIITRQIPESAVPPEILARANANMELDITKEMEMQLTNA